MDNRKVFRAKDEETNSAAKKIFKNEKAEALGTAGAKKLRGKAAREALLSDFRARNAASAAPISFEEAVSAAEAKKAEPDSSQTARSDRKAEKKNKNAKGAKLTFKEKLTEFFDDVARLFSESELDAEVRREKQGKKKKGQVSVRAWVLDSKRNFILTAAGALLLVSGIVVSIVLLASANKGGIPPVITVKDDYVETFDATTADKYAGVILAKTDDAGESYLKETLFVGDSNTARIELYRFMTLDNVIGIESMGIQSVTKNNCVYFVGRANPVKIPEAVSLMKPRRIILNFGTNNIAQDDVETFIEEYGKTLDALNAAYPYADIIIQSIPPLGSNRTNESLTMKIVDEYNLALLDLALERGLAFFNVSEVLKGSDNYMRSDFVIEDGIHISKAGFEAYFRYVRQHAHIVEDTRPQPIGDIPARRAAPVVETSDPFSCDSVVSGALQMFLSNGFEGASGDMSGATTIQYAIPDSTKGGEEVNVAGNLYSFVRSQTKIKKGKVSISYAKSGEVYVFYVTLLEIRDCTEGHWGDWTVTKEATCTEDGSKTRTCEVCGTVETEVIAAKGHQGEWTTVAATCTVAGSKTRTCTVCGTVETVAIPAKGHTWGEWITNDAAHNAYPATCTADGRRVRICSVCHVEEGETVPALGHTVSAWTTTDPTCTAVGNKSGVCSVCGQTITQELSALGHTWSAWTVITPATCGADGSQSHTCSVCGESGTEPIPATGAHTFVNGVCSVCGVADPNYVPPTP